MGKDSQIRVDKWLWYARFFKTRSIATRYVNSGELRINSIRVKKANSLIKLGDILTFSRATKVLIIKVEALANRRGPAREASELYDNITPLSMIEKNIEEKALSPGIRDAGAGRPTKRQRRKILKFLNITLNK